MFYGQYSHNLDDKNRLIIPARFMKLLTPAADETLFMTRGFGGGDCISFFPKDSWEELEAKFKTLNFFQPRESRFLREMYMYTFDAKIDRQNRILVPQTLLDLARIKDDVILVGSGPRFEAWNPAVFEEYLNSGTETFDQTTEIVMKI